jgi:hypothetical protein
VKSGYGKVSLALLLFGALASQAGRVGDAQADLWLTADLSEPAPAAQSCAQSTPVQPRELVFEMIPSGGDVAEEAAVMASAGHEVVSFGWNPATGELSYDTTAPTGIFSDLVAFSPTAGRPTGRSCGSR